MATVGSLTEPLITSLSTASILCAEIKKNRHCGSVHTQLDLLETSLLNGPSFIASQSAGLESATIGENAQEEFGNYTTQLALICGRLDSIAHPSHTSHEKHESKHHPHHKHEHRSHSSHSGSSSDEKEKEHDHHIHHSNPKPLIFSAFEPIHHHHHHKEVEDPHFHEIREAWESVRQRIGATVDGLKKSGKVEEVFVETTEKIEIKEEGAATEEIVKKVEKIEIKDEGEKVEIKKETEKVETKKGERDKVDIVKEDEKVYQVGIKEDEEKVEAVKDEVKHVEAKESDIIVVEVEGHHKAHEDDISPGDYGSESESENEERKILEYELKEVEAKA